MMNQDPYIGQQIGNYRLVEKIACGSFGCVYRAEHTRLKNRVAAIKLLNAPLATHEQQESFMQEADLMAMLEHPHILHVLDAGTHNGFPYLITEYCPDGSLRDRIKRQSSQPFPIEEALSILTQIAEALQFAHEHNIVHRDLKPENILFNVKGQALLADFGIAKMLDTIGVRQGTIIGTPTYMAPEQFRGLVSRESDQYSLGCIAYELFTGRKPFVAPDMAALMFKHLMEQPVAPRQINVQLSEYTEQTILKALVKEREGRHADIASFTATLQKSLEQQKSERQWLGEGLTYEMARRYEEALAVYEQAIRLNPNDASAYLYKSRVLSSLKRYEEALAACEQAIRLNPNFVDACNRKGDALAKLGRYEEALAAYEQAIRLNPNNADAYTNKGGTLYGLKRYEEALIAYEQVLRLDPNDVMGNLAKGMILEALGRYKEALAAYEQLLHLYPNLSFAYENKGRTLEKLARTQEAQQAYEKARQLGYKG